MLSFHHGPGTTVWGTTNVIRQDCKGLDFRRPCIPCMDLDFTHSIQDSVGKESQDQFLGTTFLLTIMVESTKGSHRCRGYATIWQFFYLFTLKSLISYNELFLDLFQIDTVVQFSLCSHLEHIPHFNHRERKHYSWLKVPFSISFYSLSVEKSLKSKLLELNWRGLGGTTPRKEHSVMSMCLRFSVGI